MDNSQVLISVENVAPSNGTALTPLWVGFHNGQFDTFDEGRPASQGVERIAEDGNAAVLSQEFEQSGFGGTQAVIQDPEDPNNSGPLRPGDVRELMVEVADPATSGRYLSYAAMVLPSNDFFVANDDQLKHEIFDSRGRFIGADFTIMGKSVLDAGTEVSDEIPANTAFLGQLAPDTGVVEGGVIRSGEGFIEGGNILSSPDFANADFTAPDYQIARVRVFNAVVGEDGDDRLKGTSKDDYIAGNGGNDNIYARSGNDRVVAGLGNDQVFGQNGNDELLGGGGDDYINGGRGDDVISGGAGQNILRGGPGDDTYVLSSEGFADILGFQGNDRLSLGSSLQFSDLSITQDNRNTLIQSGNEQIALLHRVDATTITEATFV